MNADDRDLVATLESVARSEIALGAFLSDVGAVDPARSSLLPGWTVGHVLTHIARNADSHVAMLSGSPQYERGAEGRAADIEAGARRPWGDLVADVAAAGVGLTSAYAGHAAWDGEAQSGGGLRPMTMLPQLRQREVELHRIDLGLGYEFASLPRDYVRRELRILEMLWNARQPMGLTGLPPAALTLRPTDRLAWLTGRLDVDGLAPSGLF